MNITGTHLNYYFVCKRKLWLFADNTCEDFQNAPMGSEFSFSCSVPWKVGL
ncbi:MAG TPA: hypothetical protein DEQ30_00400 [Porphyromonadaceae bacterium]|nr:hypothetical protein [Porphyromonadaceae bacterium]